jgi:hypothetical protein
MADAKEKKEVTVAALEVSTVLGIIVLMAAWPAIVTFSYGLFGELGGPPLVNQITQYSNIFTEHAVPLFRGTMGFIIGLSFPVSLFFLIGIVYCVEQLKHIRRKEEEKYRVNIEPGFEENVQGNNVLAERWDRVQGFIGSENPNDWRQAIIEADIMLEDVLTALGYQGNGIGEKLKRVELGDMKARQDAWDAHLVRNRVAHDGAEFALTKYEAQNTINQYKKVFEEFYHL